MINTNDTIHDENHPKWLREKALKALTIAKELDDLKLEAGATYKRIDNKTIKLINKK